MATRFDAVRRLEFELLRNAGALPHPSLNNASLAVSGTPVLDAATYDFLFERVALYLEERAVGYVDFGVHPAMGSIVSSVVYGVGWDEDDIVDAALAVAAKKGINSSRNECKFIAYSFPRVGIEVRGASASLLLDVFSMLQVSNDAESREFIPNLERTSYLDQPEDFTLAKKNRFLTLSNYFEERLGNRDPEAIARSLLEEAETEMRINPEVRAFCQNFERWCVPASLEMVYDFHRMARDQGCIAEDLGLSPTGPGLAINRLNVVIEAVRNTHGSALLCSRVDGPSLDDFRLEIDGDRPVISFAGRHSRVITGYVFVNLPDSAIKITKLILNDPECCPSTSIPRPLCPPLQKTEDTYTLPYDVNFNITKRRLRLLREILVFFKADSTRRRSQ